jgi:hypothetical protein
MMPSSLFSIHIAFLLYMIPAADIRRWRVKSGSVNDAMQKRGNDGWWSGQMKRVHLDRLMSDLVWRRDPHATGGWLAVEMKATCRSLCGKMAN